MNLTDYPSAVRARGAKIGSRLIIIAATGHDGVNFYFRNQREIADAGYTVSKNVHVIALDDPENEIRRRFAVVRKRSNHIRYLYTDAETHTLLPEVYAVELLETMRTHGAKLIDIPR